MTSQNVDKKTRQHPFWQALYLSFFSKSLYRDVTTRWRGLGWGYLLVSQAVFTGLIMIGTHIALNQAIAQQAPAIIQQLPVITIQDGKATSDLDKPLPIRDPRTGTPLALIDTTGKITSLSQVNVSDKTGKTLPLTQIPALQVPFFGLLTQTQLLVRLPNPARFINTSETVLWTYDFSQIKSMRVDQSTLTQWATTFGHWFSVVMYPVVLIYSLPSRIILELILAVLGLPFAQLLEVKLNFPALIRLAVVSTTPVLLINAILPLFGLLFIFLIALGYLFYAIAVNEATPNKKT
jgi:hypothetical protein